MGSGPLRVCLSPSHVPIPRGCPQGPRRNGGTSTQGAHVSHGAPRYVVSSWASRPSSTKWGNSWSLLLGRLAGGCARRGGGKNGAQESRAPQPDVQPRQVGPQPTLLSITWVASPGDLWQVSPQERPGLQPQSAGFQGGATPAPAPGAASVPEGIGFRLWVFTPGAQPSCLRGAGWRGRGSSCRNRRL